MTLEPRTDTLSQVEAARQSARRQARAMSSGLVALLSVVVALAIVSLFVLLDYRFDQTSHKLIKIIGGASLFVGILSRPDLGLLSLPVLTPLLGLMPKVPIPGVNPLNVLVLTVFMAYAIPASLRRETVLRMGRIGWVLLAVVAVAGLSVVRGAAFPTGFTYDAGEAGTQLFRCSMTFTAYFIAYAMSRRAGQRSALAWAIVAGLLAESFFTILHGRSGRGSRAVGTFGQSNDLGAFLAMFSVFAASLVPGVKQWYGKFALLAATAVGSLAVFLTVSRGAIASLGVGLLIVALRTSKLLVFVIVALLVTSPLWTPDFVKDRILGTQIENEDSDEVTLESSSQLRVDTWRAIVDVVSEHPLDGVGFTGLGYVLPDMGSARGVHVKDSAHSTYLRFLGEMGVFGLVLLLFLFWSCWKLGRAAERAATTPFDRQLGVGLSIVTIVMALNCAFGDRFFPITISGNFWILCALANNVVSEKSTEPA